MDNNIDRTKPKAAYDSMFDHGALPQTNDLQPNVDRANIDRANIDRASVGQDEIFLPAIKAKEQKPAPFQTKIKKSNSRPKNQDRPLTLEADTKVERLESADFLHEYHSQTNGLRELLSTIDPNDRAGCAHPSPQRTSFEARLEANLIENAMHLPHSRSSLPGSPDLPIGPTRWGLYLSSLVGALAFLFIFALGYSHMSSPTGIDWAKAKSGTAYFWHKLAAGWSGDEIPVPPASQTAKIILPEPLQIDPSADETTDNRGQRRTGNGQEREGPIVTVEN